MTNYSTSLAQNVTSALYKTFGWMSAGLALTGGVAYALWTSLYAYNVASLRLAIIPLIVVQFALVVAISGFYRRFSYSTLVGFFLAYAALTGVTLSPLFIVYELSSLIGVFFIAAGMFALMAVYGLVTKHDLSTLGVFAYAAFFGLLILQLVNLFIRSASFDKTLAFFGVIVFAAITAFDIQKIKMFLYEMAHDREEQNKMAVAGALTLYLDFINMFLKLLRLLGKPRKN